MDGAEKSFSHTSEKGPAYLKNNQAAAWRHYWRYLWAGMELSGVLILGAIIFRISSTETRYELTAGSYSETDFGSLAKNLISLGVMFLICSGTAAAVGGLLRHKHLVRLSKRVRSHKKLIWGSLMGFEISVLLIAVLHW